MAILGLAMVFSAFAPTPAMAWDHGTKDISAKALTSHECDSSELHFVITQVDTEAHVPKSIQVTWANGNTETIWFKTNGKYVGKTAHYSTTSNLDSTVTSATATIYSGWSGQFNLSHGPCGETPPPSVTPEGTLSVSSACESITFSASGVKPEGAEVVIKLDGDKTSAGTYTVAPGDHTVDLWVNGEMVDTQIEIVEKCQSEQPADKVTYSEWQDGDKSCESKTVDQSRTKTVTPYVWNGSDWVLDTANATSTTETQSRPMTPEELKKCEGTPPPDNSCQGLTGSIKTTLADGSVVNGNIYQNKSDVYVSGSQLGDVTKVYVRVTDPSGSTVLSSVKEVTVMNGSFGPVQLPTFSDTPNNGGEYKVWVSTSSDFESKCTKSDNFKVKGEQPPTTCPEGTTWTDTNGNGKVDEGECQQPPVDVCPDIPGNQPEGTDCTPPPVDVCPNVPGNQPEGTDCNPPTDACPNLPGNQPAGTDCSPVTPPHHPHQPPATPTTPNTPGLTGAPHTGFTGQGGDGWPRLPWLLFGLGLIGAAIGVRRKAGASA
jgi:hypothetical protein